MADGSAPQVSAGEVGMFLIEIVGLIGIGRLGWHLGDATAWRVTLAALFVLAASGSWTLFRTRGFVPLSGEPVVAVPGPMRVVIEVSFYALGAWGLWASGWTLAAMVFAASVAVVMVSLRDRYAALLLHREDPG